MKRYLGFILTIFFLALFGIFFANNKEDFAGLLEIPILTLVAISALKLIVIFNAGLFIKVVLTPFEKKIGLIESYYLALLSTIGNYFLPLRGGAGIRAVYLKKKFNLTYSHFLSTLSGNYVLVFLINSFIALILLGIIHTTKSVYSIPLYLLFGAIFLITLSLSIINVPEKLLTIRTKIPLLNTLLEIFSNIVKGWQFITKHKTTILMLALLTLFNFSITASLSFLEYNAIGVSLSFVNLLLYSSLAVASLLISITPGSLGIREAIFIFFSTIIGVTNSEILQVAIIDRGMTFSLLFLLYIIVKVTKIEKRFIKA